MVVLWGLRFFMGELPLYFSQLHFDLCCLFSDHKLTVFQSPLDAIPLSNSVIICCRQVFNVLVSPNKGEHSTLP
jgi:hypothetical protein